MATRTPQTVTSSGLNPAAHPASGGGDKVPPECIVRAINGSGSSVNLTMVTPQTVDGNLAVPDRVVAVPAGESRYVRATSFYRNPVDGLVDLQWSATTSVTFEVIV